MVFILDTDVLGGADFNYVESHLPERGRSIMIQWSQSGDDQDLELFGYSIRFFPGETLARD